MTVPKLIPVVVLAPVVLSVPVRLTAKPLTEAVPDEAELVIFKVDAVPVVLEKF